MKYFFILGRNPELSRAEIFSYFEARKISFEEILFEDNFLILELKGDINLNIQEFGGIIMLGKINFSGERKEILGFIEKDELISADKFSFNVIGNYDIEQEIYEKFKKEGRKTMLRHGRGELKIQDKETIELPNADFHIFCHKSNKIYFGLINQVFSHKKVKERDMKKPFRREELAISPRLARILINLSQTKEKQILLDPFCGIGGILQEAMLKNINVRGIDKDKRAIMQAKQNLDWLKKNYKIISSYELKILDSKNLADLYFDGVAAEPNLGELVKKKLRMQEAQSFIKKFENSIIPVLQRLKKIKNQEVKIAITFPYIRNLSVSINNVLTKTGLHLSALKGVKFPIKEFRPDQFVSREIWVFV
jgi:tRNA G10  N-methylase Trm11